MRPALLGSAIALTVALAVALGIAPGRAAEPPPPPAPSAADQLNQQQLDLLQAANQPSPSDAFLGPPLMVQSMQDIGALH